MDAATVDSHISELEKLKSHTRIWRTGATLVALLIAVICVGTMYNNVQSLFRPGPAQDEFAANVNAGLQRDVVPNVQKLAVQTVIDSGPIVQTEVGKLSDRLPDIADASLKQFELLQTNLPQRSEKVLDETFGTMMKSREAKLREMFPDATDEKIQTLLTNLTDEGVTCLSNVNKRMFSKHVDAISNIAVDIEKIESIEAPHIKNDTPTWQMGLMLFDIAREDLKDLPVFTTPGSGATQANAKATAQANTKAGLQPVSLPLRGTTPATSSGHSSGY